MQSILYLLGFWDFDEQDSGLAVGRDDQALIVSRLVGIVRVLVQVEGIASPDRLGVRVASIDR